MKINFNSNDLPPNKTIETHNATIVARAAFHENNKFYLQLFVDELYELYII